MTTESARLIDAKSADDISKDLAATEQSRIRIWVWRLLKLTLLSVLIFCVFLFFVYRSMHRAPNFHHHNLQQPMESLEVCGDKFETKLLDVQNAIQRQQSWQGIFVEDEVNGWLAADCPIKFPQFIPDYVENPRVYLAENEISFAFRFRPTDSSFNWFTPFILIVGDVFVAEPEGQIAVRLKSVRSGFIPIPIAQVADNITQHLRKSGLDVAWSDVEGDPLALVSIPPDRLRLGNRSFRIDTILCRGKEIEIVGQASAGGLRQR